MKILQIGRTLPDVGGAETHIFEISKQLSKKIELILITQKAKRPRNFLPIELVEVPCLGKNIYIRNLTFTFFSLPYLLKTIYLKKPDIIHIHFGTFQGFLGIIIKLFGKKLIFTCHGFSGWKIAKYRISRYIARYLLTLADKIICVSPAIIKDLKNIGIYSKKLVYIPNGVNIKEFEKIKKRKIKIKKNIVFFGRLQKQKGVFYLIKAFREILNKYKDFKLIIIGDGPERKNLEKLATNMKRIIFTGYIKRENLLRYLTSAYMIVLPSVYEGFPLAVLEAMASGRPVITTNLRSIEEVISKGIVMVRPKNIEDLKRGMEFLINNPRKARKIGKLGEKLSKKFDWELVSKKLLCVYKSVFNKIL